MSFTSWWAKWKTLVMWLALLVSIAALFETAMHWPANAAPSLIFLVVGVGFFALVIAIKLALASRRHN